MVCRCLGLLLILLALPACRAESPPYNVRPQVSQAIRAQFTPLATSSGCAGYFLQHTLPHTTQVHGPAVHMFETNGAGVAVNDLNQDGLPEIVLANLNGPPTLLWNEGYLRFSKETLGDDNTRSVNIVDVDGDSWPDIVFTHITSGVSYWRNSGGAIGPHFVRTPLPGILKPAHSMAWGDLNGDGRLDLVTGSYDAELHRALGDAFMFSNGAGVIVYTNRGDRFEGERVHEASQALAISLYDIDDDGRLDIHVGNDFDFPDYTWFQSAEGWQMATPFAETSHSTMSLDWGDVDNDGRLELFSTDMNPYDTSVETMAQWLPMMEEMPHRLPNDDPQQTQNTLQTALTSGQFRNRATAHGVEATGWSWSGKFGDLDHDGFLDLYVVNGMMDAVLFDYLPNQELVEENQALRNLGNGTFVPAPSWLLAVTDSGRGLSLADLDLDGDLDMVVNNLRTPSLLLENQLCPQQGASLQVDLRQPGHNPFALGAHVALVTSTGTYHRDVRAGSGYLSGDPSRLHFGFPADSKLQRLEITWPDGRYSELVAPAANTLLTLSRQES